eukprot:4156331-Pyramimonas_sp.AAC.1
MQFATASGMEGESKCVSRLGATRIRLQSVQQLQRLNAEHVQNAAIVLPPCTIVLKSGASSGMEYDFFSKFELSLQRRIRSSQKLAAVTGIMGGSFSQWGFRLRLLLSA